MDRPDYAVSLEIGSVRLTERIRSMPLADPHEVRAYVDGLFVDVAPPYPVAAVLGSGGTFVTLAAVHLGVTPGLLESDQETTLSFTELTATVDRLLGMTVQEIAALTSVATGRAGVLQAGAVCAERAVARIGLSEVAISVSDILDGVALKAVTT
jgi:exopolyphosphatase/pppGpp-phosphohydrolase